ncbi:MerR family transcriptional regulator [Candidatus Paracaedibacter symbiosus]|uniref:MerR family transcriptional regulator n=1 Tax=Candidatus Paracaedibacter symbiosus TaxID=244582 RepID=UPI003B967F1A
MDIYLKAAKGETTNNDIDSDTLLKIGELAKAVGETIVTIRYWTKEGLLDVAKITESGYHLYEIGMIQRCEYIKQLKKDRLTIEEIRKKLK